MRCRIFRAGAAIVVAASISAATVPRAQAIGYWNMPGNFCQCIGCGWGAGYHAPLVLGPPRYSGCVNPHEVRLPCPPGPPCDYNCGATCGCGDGGQSLLEPSPLPVVESHLAPATAACWSPLLR